MATKNERQLRRINALLPILNRYDPVGFGFDGPDSDEYDLEAVGIVTILERADNISMIAERVRWIFCNMFGNDQLLEDVDWDAMAKELWKVSRTQQW